MLFMTQSRLISDEQSGRSSLSHTLYVLARTFSIDNRVFLLRNCKTYTKERESMLYMLEPSQQHMGMLSLTMCTSYIGSEDKKGSTHTHTHITFERVSCRVAHSPTRVKFDMLNTNYTLVGRFSPTRLIETNN